jgi:hypothetical protein
MNYWLVIFDAWIIVASIDGINPVAKSSNSHGGQPVGLAALFRASHPARVAVPQRASEAKPVICGCFIVLSGKRAFAYPK